MSALLTILTCLPVMVFCQINVDSLPRIEVPPTIKNNSLGGGPEECTSFPEYPGGMEALYLELYSYITYPKMAQTACIHGRVFIEFTVDSTGHMRDLKVLKGIGGGCDEEALNAFKSLKHCWVPATDCQKQPIDCRMRQPVYFEFE